MGRSRLKSLSRRTPWAMGTGTASRRQPWGVDLERTKPWEGSGQLEDVPLEGPSGAWEDLMSVPPRVGLSHLLAQRAEAIVLSKMGPFLLPPSILSPPQPDLSETESAGWGKERHSNRGRKRDWVTLFHGGNSRKEARLAPLVVAKLVRFLSGDWTSYLQFKVTTGDCIPWKAVMGQDPPLSSRRRGGPMATRKVERDSGSLCWGPPSNSSALFPHLYGKGVDNHKLLHKGI